MPRLGENAEDDEMQPLHRRRQATAYPGVSDSPLRRRIVFAILLVGLLWILPNFFFRDYREEALESLRASGKTEEQIERFFPKSISEKKKEQAESYKTIREEMEELKQRLQQLEEHVQMPNRSATSNKPDANTA